MKLFVVIACALACASAYKGPEHKPIIGKDGVPIDTPEVQHARAAHLSQLEAAKAEDSHSNYDAHAQVASGPLYHGPQHIPVIGKDGVPVDTAEVQHARSAHLAQLAAAKTHESSEHSSEHGAAIIGHKEYSGPLYHGPQHIPKLDKHGVPIETAEVQHAKAAHLAQVAAAKTH